MPTELQSALRERFYAVNGRHPMTVEDDAYASAWYVTIEDLAQTEGIDVDELASSMLAGALPLPSYVRSDGVFMVPRDLLGLAREAGTLEQLPAWFGRQFADAADAVDAWNGYVNGRWVCLREVTPVAMQRKEALVGEIELLLAEEPRRRRWHEELTVLVDELDELEPPFTAYDRLRFGGPVSRDRCVTMPREEHLRP